MNKRKIVNQKGISLIALVVTIITLLILAVVSFNAIMGENGIIKQSQNAKVKTEDESEQEKIFMAWKAGMTQYYEDLASGKTSRSHMNDYFTKEVLNKELDGINGGQITFVEEDTDGTYNLRYESTNGIKYTLKLQMSGDIVAFTRGEISFDELVPVPEVPEVIESPGVWVSYYESSKTLAYSSRSSVTIPDQTPTVQWNITNGISSKDNVPWGTEVIEEDNVTPGAYSIHVYYTGYCENIENVIVLDRVTPTNTDYLFAFLNKATSFQNMDNILTGATSIGDWEFYQCESLNINIPNTITSIGDYAFYQCTSLTSAIIPNTVTAIGNDAFFGCSSLATLSLSNNITGIGTETFKGCSNLVTLEIPNGVTNIGDRAFMWCSKLTTVDIPSSMTSIGSNAFDFCSKLETIRVHKPNGSINGGNYAWGASNASVVWDT